VRQYLISFRWTHVLDVELWAIILGTKCAEFPITGPFLILATGATLARLAFTGRRRYCLIALAVPAISIIYQRMGSGRIMGDEERK